MLHSLVGFFVEKLYCKLNKVGFIVVSLFIILKNKYGVNLITQMGIKLILLHVSHIVLEMLEQ